VDVNKSLMIIMEEAEGKSKSCLTSLKLTLHIPSSIMSRK
jgi:hypothetical protein